MICSNLIFLCTLGVVLLLLLALILGGGGDMKSEMWSCWEVWGARKAELRVSS